MKKMTEEDKKNELERLVLLYQMPDISPETKDCGYISADSLPHSWQERLERELPPKTDIYMIDYFQIVGDNPCAFFNPPELVKEVLDSSDLSKAGAIRVSRGSWGLERRRLFTLAELANTLLSEQVRYKPENLAFICNPRLAGYLRRVGEALGYKVKEMAKLPI